MDAFSVSIANCLANPRMNHAEMSGMTFAFGFFQFLMPMVGWFCVHTIISIFEKFQPFIPWIAFILLLYIGGKMVLEGILGEVEEEGKKLTFGVLMIQSVAWRGRAPPCAYGQRHALSLVGARRHRRRTAPQFVCRARRPFHGRGVRLRQPSCRASHRRNTLIVTGQFGIISH